MTVTMCSTTAFGLYTLRNGYYVQIICALVWLVTAFILCFEIFHSRDLIPPPTSRQICMERGLSAGSGIHASGYCRTGTISNTPDTAVCFTLTTI